MTTSVLIPSFGRVGQLQNCLASLARQTTLPDQVLIVWQDTDTDTRDTAEAFAASVPFVVTVLHSPERGVVPAENLALDHATGAIILLIDDDAIAPPDWIARHVSHYADPTVGAVGGSADNFHPDGSKFTENYREPIGRLTWYGKLHGNMHTQAVAWQTRPPCDVDHLVGYNCSLRRAAFDRFEVGLRRYWQLFELDACLQVRQRGFRVVFDYANVIEHHPTNTAYVAGRAGDLEVKIFNAAYNHAFVLAKHSSWGLRGVRLAYLLAIGSVGAPGLIGFVLACRRYGHPRRELGILLRTWKMRWTGHRAGKQRRRLTISAKL